MSLSDKANCRCGPMGQSNDGGQDWIIFMGKQSDNFGLFGFGVFRLSSGNK